MGGVWKTVSQSERSVGDNQPIRAGVGRIATNETKAFTKKFLHKIPHKIIS